MSEDNSISIADSLLYAKILLFYIRNKLFRSKQGEVCWESNTQKQRFDRMQNTVFVMLE